MASYDNGGASQLELVYHIATRLGERSPSPKTVVAKTFVCPGYWQKAPQLSSDINSLVGRKIYIVNDDLKTNTLLYAKTLSVSVAPFGYPSTSKPIRSTCIQNFTSPSEAFAVSDLDRAIPTLDPTSSWLADLPAKPVHGAIRNQLFFDWHAQAVKW
jgi:hypothetical protein